MPFEVDDGFESGSLAAYHLVSTPTITTADAHGGTHSLQIQQASNVAEQIQVTPPANATVSVGRYFVKLNALAVGTRYITSAPLTLTTAKAASVRFQADGTVDIIFGGAITVFSGLIVQTGRWYRVDYKATCGQNPYTFDAIITDDTGAQYTASTTGAFAADTFKLDRFGNIQAIASDLLIDDLAISRDPADYPIGWPSTPLLAGAALGTAAASGPAIAGRATIAAGFVAASPTALGPNRISQPVIVYAGYASARASATQVIAVASALSPAAAAAGTGAVAAAGSLKAVAAASTVGISVDE